MADTSELLDSSTHLHAECFNGDTLDVVFKRDSDLDRHINKESDRNSYVAKRLKVAKHGLIELLSQATLTPLWLIHKHEQYVNNINQEPAEETESSDDMSGLLSALCHDYDLCAAEPSQCSQIDSMQQTIVGYPFRFDELAELTKTTRQFARWLDGNAYPVNVNHSTAGSSDRQMFRLFETHVEQLGSRIRLTWDNESSETYLENLRLAERRWLKWRNRLVTMNSGLVLFIANQFRGSVFLDFDDLVQEGQTGLLKAVDRFDYRLGFKFSTYAGYWIRQAISRTLSRHERVVRIPCGQVGIINKFFRDKDRLQSLLGREPTVTDIAEHTGLSPERIDSILTTAQSAVSLESSADDDDDAFGPIDFLEQRVFTSSISTLARTELEQLLIKAINVLNSREAKIVFEHFGIAGVPEKTLNEIGMDMNLTRERVRQIEVQAFNKIKRHYGNELSNFL